jgi:hypothetical protein
LAERFVEHKLATTAHFIAALPYQSYSSCISDLKLLAKKSVFLGISIFYPVIESGFFKELKKRFCVKASDYGFFRSSCAYFDKFISRDRILSIFYFSRIINFIKEILDGFSLKGKSFSRLLEEKSRDFNIINNILVSPKKIDRISLGIILLNRLFKENKVFIAQEYKKDKQFHYFFKEESFIKEGDLRKFISGLTIRGLFSGASIKIKRAR